MLYNMFFIRWFVFLATITIFTSSSIHASDMVESLLNESGLKNPLLAAIYTGKLTDAQQIMTQYNVNDLTRTTAFDRLMSSHCQVEEDELIQLITCFLKKDKSLLNEPSFFDHATPLVTAIKRKRWKVAQYLFDQGANVNTIHLTGKTAFEYLLEDLNDDSIELAKAIISKRAGKDLNKSLNALRKLHFSDASRPYIKEILATISKNGVDLKDFAKSVYNDALTFQILEWIDILPDNYKLIAQKALEQEQPAPPESCNVNSNAPNHTSQILPDETKPENPQYTQINNLPTLPTTSLPLNSINTNTTSPVLIAGSIIVVAGAIIAWHYLRQHKTNKNNILATDPN